MPRKKGAEAEADTQRAHEARLQYLSRNLEFRQLIDSLTKLRDALPGGLDGQLTLERVKAVQEFRRRLEEAAGRWGVPWDLLSQLSWHKWREKGDPKDRIPAAFVFFDSPVSAWTDAPPSFVSAFLGGDPPESSPEDTRYLNLRVDLEHPVHTLLPLIEKELGRHSQEHRHGRRRLDKVEFHLKVFDLAESGETFKTIALELKKRLPTVKSAFLAARRNVYGLVPGPSKKQLPLIDFDLDKHNRKCSICQKAENFADMCPRARRYGLQDHKSQRELTRLDTAQDIAEKSATSEPIVLDSEPPRRNVGAPATGVSLPPAI